MKGILPVLGLTVGVFASWTSSAHASIQQEDFLPGRIVSRTQKRTILVKCAARMAEAPQACVGYQFYYSATGDEADAAPTSKYIYTTTSIEQLKSKPVVYNLFDVFFPEGGDWRESGLYTLDFIDYLNEYEDSWGESVGARVAYGAARGAAYGVLVPIGAAMDAVGTSVAAPVTGVAAVFKYINNIKFKKLLRAIRSGKKVRMNIDNVYRLRDRL